jgi:hypothetical protein
VGDLLAERERLQRIAEIEGETGAMWKSEALASRANIAQAHEALKLAAQYIAGNIDGGKVWDAVAAALAATEPGKG